MQWDGERLSQESTGYPAKEFSEVKSELSEGKGEANRGWGRENLIHCYISTQMVSEEDLARHLKELQKTII